MPSRAVRSTGTAACMYAGNKRAGRQSNSMLNCLDVRIRLTESLVVLLTNIGSVPAGKQRYWVHALRYHDTGSRS